METVTIKEEPLEMVEPQPDLECTDLVYQLKSEMICEARNVKDDVDNFQYSRDFLYAGDDPTERSLVKLESLEYSGYPHNPHFAYTSEGIQSVSGAIKAEGLQATSVEGDIFQSASSDEVKFHPEIPQPLFEGFLAEETRQYASAHDSLSKMIASLEEKLQLNGNVGDNNDCNKGCINNNIDDLFINKAVSVYDDTKVAQDARDDSRAWRTAPAALFVYFSAVKFSGFGVWTNRHIPRGTVFGPYQGTITDSTLESCYVWKMEWEGQTWRYVDACKPGLANWMRYTNFALRMQDCNLMAFVQEGDVYYRTVHPVPPCTELLLWFVSGLEPCIHANVFQTRKLQQIFQRPYIKPFGAAVWCPECDLSFASLVYLEDHRPWCHGPRRRTHRASMGSLSGDTKDPNRVVVAVGTKPRQLKPQKMFQCSLCEARLGDKDGLARHYAEHVGSKPFHCDVCWREFYRTSDLAQHVKRHVVKKAFTCNVCYKSFKDPSLLTRHMRIHAWENPFHCNICQKSFQLASQLRVHSRMHTGEKPFECDVCSKRFKLMSYLKRHAVIHTDERPYRCGICGQSFSMASNRRKHLLIHTGERNFECLVCQKKFVRPQHLTSHMRTHTGEQPYQCRICEKRYRSSWSLTTHTRTHTGVKPFECDVCRKTFSNSSDRAKHERTHSGTKSFKCDTCGKHFSQSRYLAKHKKLHTGAMVKRYQCDICPKQYVLPANLTIHKRTHTGERPFKCDVCKKWFNARSNLITHVKRHIGDKAFECHVCHKQFVGSEDLIRHRRIHTGEKPYPCKVCQKRFSRSSHLKKHAQTHKPDKKRFKCDVCHKKFTTLSYLSIHRRGHTGERPYHCDKCPKVFLRGCHLKVHQRTHTGLKLYKCNICPKKFTQRTNLKKHTAKH